MTYANIFPIIANIFIRTMRLTMTQRLTVTLSTSPANEAWGEKNTLTSNGQGFTIHITSDSVKDNLVVIQKGARKIQSNGVEHVSFDGQWDKEQQWAFYLGFVTAKHTQTVQWSDEHASELMKMQMAFDWTRKMTNLPPQDVYPLSLANQTVEFISQLAPEHVTSEVVVGDDLLKQGWIGTHSVGRASAHPPVLLTLDYNPTGDDNAPVNYALIGKGITFDSGGYSIKASEGMVSMKCDMGGAATVAGALALAISQGLDKRVKLILCCAENLIAGNAYKLGDVLTYKNGTTVEIVNTDAEGRVVLADGLLHAQELGAEKIIDAATLTGAAMAALGSDYNALFALDQDMSLKAQQAAKEVNEGAWPLPLEKFHQNHCPSAYADTANSRPQKGGGTGGASNAAGFLSRFVENDGKNWLHMDLAGAFLNSPTDKYAAGATAMGVRTIAKLISE